MRLSLELIHSIPCPTCGARQGEPCLLLTGVPRSTPHVDRRWIAEDEVRGEKLEEDEQT
jgi:hypothetical protein